jgi:hypothetical protein
MRAAIILCLLLSGCIKPQFVTHVCEQPNSCIISTCTAGGACSAKPVKLKGPLP